MKRHIPNAITCLNLMSGCVATFFAFHEVYTAALIAIIVGAMFDFCDGLSARLLGVSSPIGKELDSLADVVTFGVAPAAMLFTVILNSLKTYIAPFEPVEAYVALTFVFSALMFVLAAFSALRLAKFNLDTRQATSFIGLPTPANALFWGSLIATYSNYFELHAWLFWGAVVMCFVSCYLLVSEIPMFALKFKTWGWRGNEVKWVFLAAAVVMLALYPLFGPTVLSALWVIIAFYVVLSLLTQRKAEA